jgi:hypothetical protein
MVLHREGPGPVQRTRLAFQQPELDRDPGLTQRRLAARGHQVGIGLGEHHPADAGLDQGQ